MSRPTGNSNFSLCYLLPNCDTTYVLLYCHAPMICEQFANKIKSGQNCLFFSVLKLKRFQLKEESGFPLFTAPFSPHYCQKVNAHVRSTMQLQHFQDLTDIWRKTTYFWHVIYCLPISKSNIIFLLLLFKPNIANFMHSVNVNPVETSIVKT